MRTAKLVEAGVIDKPKWLDAILKNPPQPILGGPAPKPIVFPEDRLIQSYMARHPETKMNPISLRSREPAPARAFAMRQLELIEGGMTQHAARLQVEAETDAASPELQERRKNNLLGDSSQLASMQQAEEMSLQKAMAAFKLNGRSKGRAMIGGFR